MIQKSIQNVLFAFLLILNLDAFAGRQLAPSIIEEKFTLASDVKWASPDGFNLTMDIYTPNTGKESYPVIIMFHGGGWLINNKSIMKSGSEYLSSNGEYVVCNVNYRLLCDQENTVKMNQIVEDVLGAVAWVKENISKYKGDPEKVIVTGDSAGGHLATMVVVAGKNLSAKGFDGKHFTFKPSYIPKGKTAESLAKNGDLEVQAAIISYGAFDMYGSAKGGFEKPGNMFWNFAGAQPRGLFGNEINVEDNPEYYRAVSPVYLIPSSEEKLPPMLFTVGEKDNLTTPASIKEFMTKLKEAGHSNIEYWEHADRPHAFLDSGSNEYLGIEFEKDAIPALEVMLEYLNKIFYQ